jgi:hypothetical protein
MDLRVLAGRRDVKDNAPEDGRAKCDMNKNAAIPGNCGVPAFCWFGLFGAFKA